MGEHGDDWSSKPDVILQWLIDEKHESSTRQLTLRVFTIKFASIHSTTNIRCYSVPFEYDLMFWQSFTQALYNFQCSLPQSWRLQSFPVFPTSDGGGNLRLLPLRIWEAFMSREVPGN